MAEQSRNELMADYERDRDSAASVTEPCVRCHALPGKEECPFCERLYCEGCLALHECKGEI